MRRARTVRQVLEEAGPGLTVAVPLDERYCQFLARAAELPDNGFLRDVAARGCVEVDVSRLAGCDPDDEAVVGFEVSWTERESDLLGLDGGFPQVGPRPG